VRFRVRFLSRSFGNFWENGDRAGPFRGVSGTLGKEGWGE
jgi:hypothetical protein